MDKNDDPPPAYEQEVKVDTEGQSCISESSMDYIRTVQGISKIVQMVGV